MTKEPPPPDATEPLESDTSAVIDPRVLEILICPASGSALTIDGDELVSADGGHRYPIKDGIAMLLPDSDDDGPEAHPTKAL